MLSEILIIATFLTATVNTQQLFQGPESKCAYGLPLINKDSPRGEEYNCDWPVGDECPAGSVCNVHPYGAWAVCCWNVHIPPEEKCSFGYPTMEHRNGTIDVQNCGGAGDKYCPLDYYCNIHSSFMWSACCPIDNSTTYDSWNSTGNNDTNSTDSDPYSQRCWEFANSQEGGMCMDECITNRDCAYDEICCFNGCGKSCINPNIDNSNNSSLNDSIGNYTTVTVRNPNTTDPYDNGPYSTRCWPFNQGNGMCIQECSDDNDCGNQEICCFNGCGKNCFYIGHYPVYPYSSTASGMRSSWWIFGILMVIFVAMINQ